MRGSLNSALQNNEEPDKAPDTPTDNGAAATLPPPPLPVVDEPEPEPATPASSFAEVFEAPTPARKRRSLAEFMNADVEPDPAPTTVSWAPGFDPRTRGKTWTPDFANTVAESLAAAIPTAPSP